MMKSQVVREPIATWWRIERYSVKITPVKVVAFTASFVTHLEKVWFDDRLKETRERRDDIFPSFAEAKAEAIRRASQQVSNAQAELQRCRSALGMWESIKKPAEDS